MVTCHDYIINMLSDHENYCSKHIYSIIHLDMNEDYYTLYWTTSSSLIYHSNYEQCVAQFFNMVAMWLRALPALNHSICMAFIECWSVSSSVLPSACFKMHFTGWEREGGREGEKGERKTQSYCCDILLAGWLPFLGWDQRGPPGRLGPRAAPCHSQQHLRMSVGACLASSGWSLGRDMEFITVLMVWG